MNVFIVKYDVRFGWGAYEEATLVVVANTEEEARGLALEALPPHARREHLKYVTPVDVASASAAIIAWRES